MSSRRDFLKLAATTAATCFLPDSISKAGTIFGSKMLKIDIAGGPAKPNIIFLHADDLGYADLGCMGSDLHQTPNIDGLKADSLWFTNAYSTHSTCAPSRIGIMTGKYPARLGVINNGVKQALTGQYTLAQGKFQHQGSEQRGLSRTPTTGHEHGRTTVDEEGQQTTG